MTIPVFHGLVPGLYGVILADPPWAFKGYTAETTPHRSADEPYKVMSLPALVLLPVAQLAAPDCCLFMWTISSHMQQAFGLGEAWGFKYKARAFEWFKTTKDGLGMKMGMGHWTRQESETLLLFTRGSPTRKSRAVRSSIFAPSRQHSRKPDEQYGKIEDLVGGPYCELFAKYRRSGWDGWGDQYPGTSNDEARNQLTEAIRQCRL